MTPSLLYPATKSEIIFRFRFNNSWIWRDDSFHYETRNFPNNNNSHNGLDNGIFLRKRMLVFIVEKDLELFEERNKSVGLRHKTTVTFIVIFLFSLQKPYNATNTSYTCIPLCILCLFFYLCTSYFSFKIEQLCLRTMSYMHHYKIFQT